MKSKKEPLFEEQMKRLEEIVELLDRGDAPLALLLKNFEEGMALAHSLREFLDQAEQKVIDISKLNLPEPGLMASGLDPDEIDEDEIDDEDTDDEDNPFL